MDALTLSKAKALHEAMGRTPAWIEGYFEGELHRLQDLPLTPYQRVGIDDFAKGFRAGFFSRN